MNTPDNSGALTVDAFCARYGIGVTTFYAEVKAHRLHPVKIGRKTLVPISEGNRWLASLPPLKTGTAA
jgi:hypothetical protein